MSNGIPFKPSRNGSRAASNGASMSDFGRSNPNVFENLPQDPEDAFLVLEEHFREECDEQISRAHQDENLNIYHINYIAQVIAAINELGLQAQFADRVPVIQDVDYTTYINFSKDVKHYRTTLLIRRGRRVQGYSVRFDPATKAKVQHHIEQLRGIFEQLEVEQEKREALFNKLNALQQEVDRERTRFDAFAALAIETAGVVGDVVEKTQLLKILDSIARVMWGAKTEEETRCLPAPTLPKRIEAPKRTKTIPAQRSAPNKDDTEDEIPF